jgi:hypothetical protein
MENKNLPAFPIMLGNGETSPGLTKREYFAGLVMQGLLVNNNLKEFIIAHSLRLADELLKQLEQQ